MISYLGAVVVFTGLVLLRFFKERRIQMAKKQMKTVKTTKKNKNK